jgi:hypothetical protein
MLRSGGERAKRWDVVTECNLCFPGKRLRGRKIKAISKALALKAPFV